jgi:hypothetical protein
MWVDVHPACQHLRMVLDNLGQSTRAKILSQQLITRLFSINSITPCTCSFY